MSESEVVSILVIALCCVAWATAATIWLAMLMDYVDLRAGFYHKWKVAFLGLGAVALLGCLVVLIFNA